MFKNKSLALLYKFIAINAERFPQTGKFFDWLTLKLLGESKIAQGLVTRNANKLSHATKRNKICVIADVNIGDAITIQAIILAIQELLPGANIDYIINKKAELLLEGFPGIDTVYGVYTSAPLTAEDMNIINELLEINRYDIVFNFCPFYSNKIILPPGTIEINYLGIMPQIVKDIANPNIQSHMVLQLYNYVQRLFANLEATPKRIFRGTSAIISSDAVMQSESFIQDNGLGDHKKILFNPDTSSRFTRIPFHLQISLLEMLTELHCEILLTPGYNKKGIEHELLQALPRHKQDKCKIVPIPLPLDMFAALVDHCDAFITGDTGLLHIAAAKKISRTGDFVFKNCTAIFSIFGATPSRLYGYDSFRPGFIPSFQSAVSHTYEGNCYRNIMYLINKNLLPYDENYFFNGLNLEKIVMDMGLCLGDKDNK
jgi:ADP-heptose:LPS heptosyltransferase